MRGVSIALGLMLMACGWLLQAQTAQAKVYKKDHLIRTHGVADRTFRTRYRHRVRVHYRRHFGRRYAHRIGAFVRLGPFASQARLRRFGRRRPR